MIDLKRYPELLHPMCKRCMKDRRAKYDMMVGDEFLYRKNEFVIECNGMPTSPEAYLKKFLFDPEMWEQLTDAEKESASNVYSRTRWAKNFLKISDEESWIPRGALVENAEKYNLDIDSTSYQELMLNCTSRRKILRCGRRVGKSEMISVFIINKIMMKTNHRVLLIAPTLAAIKIVFERMRELLENADIWSDVVLKATSTPYHVLKVKNKSEVRGFTTGQGGSSGATSIRGQKARTIILDEADYLMPADLESVMAIMMDFPDVELIASSTPSGRREHFWRWDHDPQYRSFWFPAMVSPMWSKRMEYEQRDLQPTEDSYRREVLAEYTAQEAGVFQVSYIDRAKKDYNYGEGVIPNALYTIGVDWNPMAGTQICVLEGREEGENVILKVKDIVGIPHTNWSERQAVEKIMELNRIYRPFVINIDRGGGGHAAVERLHEIAVNASANKGNPADIDLIKIVHAVDFGSSIETEDPFLPGARIKRPLKPFMVENTQRRFERDQIELSSYADKEFVTELENYCIKTISYTGAPRYAGANPAIPDHKLDAFVLSVHGFVLEFSDLARPTPVSMGISILPIAGSSVPMDLGSMGDMDAAELENYVRKMRLQREEDEEFAEGGEYVDLPKEEKRPVLPRSGGGDIVSSIKTVTLLKGRYGRLTRLLGSRGRKPRRSNI